MIVWRRKVSQPLRVTDALVSQDGCVSEAWHGEMLNGVCRSTKVFPMALRAIPKCVARCAGVLTAVIMQVVEANRIPEFDNLYLGAWRGHVQMLTCRHERHHS